MACKKRVLLMALLAAAVWPAAVRAQFEPRFQRVGGDARGRAAGRRAPRGTSTVQQKPTRMRMYIQLFGQGQDLGRGPGQAEGAPRGRRAATGSRSRPTSNRSSSTVPPCPAAQAAQKRQIEAMVMEQMRARGKKPKGLQVPQTVTVTALAHRRVAAGGEVAGAIAAAGPRHRREDQGRRPVRQPGSRKSSRPRKKSLPKRRSR